MKDRHSLTRSPFRCLCFIMHYPYVSDQETMQNVTIEERVALLEIQVADIEGDISLLIENDNFLFDEQIIQDERLFSLEQETEEIEDDIVSKCVKCI